MSKTIFVVDDSNVVLSLMEEILEKTYRVMTLPSAMKMFTFLEKFTPDLILLDIEMPGMNGLDALQRLKAHNAYANIPVIFLTGVTDTFIESRGFELGAADFITKPFSETVLLNRIRHHLDIDGVIRERTAELNQLKYDIVHVFADIIEVRDRETGGHIDRTTVYIKTLMDAMLERGVYADEMGGWNLELAVSSARLHDVGKVAVSDAILNKPGPLSEEEFEIMKTHASEGIKIIERIIARTGEVEFLRYAKLFAGYHHEHWDGTGYPYRLKGTEIPLQGRIMAIVDVYDALLSRRSYKEALTNEEAMHLIMADAGRRFDPQIAGVFLAMKEQLGELAKRFS